MGDFEIIKKTTGEASDYAPFVVELYQKRNGKTEQIEDALNRLSKDAALLKGNQNSHKILLCSETDPYPPDYECNTITRGAIEILDNNELKYVILTEDGMRAYPDFEQMERPENVIFISKIVFDLQGETKNGKLDKDFIDDLLLPIEEAYKKDMRTGIHFGPGSDPVLSLQLIYELYPVVDFWRVGKFPFDAEIARGADWKSFNKKAKPLFQALRIDVSLLKEHLIDLPGPESQRADVKKATKTSIQIGEGKMAKSESPWTKGDIPTKKGNCNILVIAPHGHKEDDENTYQLARSLADQLDCYAVVNQKYRKPDGKKVSLKNSLVDLNIWKQAEGFTKTLNEFLVPIQKAKDEIIAKYKSVFILHIHGIRNSNIKTVAGLIEDFKKRPYELQALIGYGQRENDDTRYTASKDKLVIPLIKSLSDLGISSAIAPVEYIINKGKKKWYCGNDERRLNQYLCNPKAQVQSIQIELKKKDVRDNTSWESTAAKLASVARNFAIPEVLPNLPEKQESDFDLVERAYDKILDIFASHYGDAMLAAGELIFNDFYNADIALAKSKNPTKSKSLALLEEKLKGSSQIHPSRSWLNNAVKLYVETKELETTVPTYGKLEVSKKILLFQVNDIKKKTVLINETFDKKYTVSQLKDEIDRILKKTKPTIPLRLTHLINRPGQLFGDLYDEIANEKSLSRLRLTTIQRLQTQADGKIAEIGEKIETQNNYVERYKQLRKTLDEIEKKKTNFKSAEIKKPQKQKEVKSKFKGWEKIKIKAEDGVEKEAIAPVITSESRVKRCGRNRQYELKSALQKSIRLCEVNESRYFARELMDAGYPGGVLKQLILIAAEDVGLADPSLIVYEKECLDSFDNLIKQYKIKKREACNFPELCNIVDRAVIAAAISYKSRLLPQLSFATLFDIYEKKDFTKDLSEYLDRFVLALKNEDEKHALYYAYVVDILFDSKDEILTMIQSLSGMRNKDLIQKWVEEYKRNDERLMLAGSIVLLCRDLKYPHGEYNDAVHQYLSVPIKAASIPDRAYDMHTSAGARRGRSFEHFFDEAATVKNERFSNDWEEAGRTAYIRANQEGLGKAAKIIEAIKKKL